MELLDLFMSLLLLFITEESSLIQMLTSSDMSTGLVRINFLLSFFFKLCLGLSGFTVWTHGINATWPTFGPRRDKHCLWGL